MKHAKIPSETVKFGDPVRVHGRVELGSGAALQGSERQQGWLARGVDPVAVPSFSHPGVIRESRARTTPKALAVPESVKEDAKPMRAADVLRQPIPTLTRTKLKLSGRVPRILPVRVVAESRFNGEAHIDVPANAPVCPEQLGPPPLQSCIEPYLEPPRKVVPEIPPHVEVQVIPTPKKRAPRYTSAAEESPEPPVTKPLKVIRKRKAEAPKIFETVPKAMPQAMLEGIETGPEDPDGEQE